VEILTLMIPVTVVVAFVLIALFNWAVNNGQYEDLERAGNDALFDEDELTADRRDPCQKE
jgi:cbb3-type cytochrome oxidase maturation protein